MNDEDEYKNVFHRAKQFHSSNQTMDYILPYRKIQIDSDIIFRIENKQIFCLIKD